MCVWLEIQDYIFANKLGHIVNVLPVRQYPIDPLLLFQDHQSLYFECI